MLETRNQTAHYRYSKRSEYVLVLGSYFYNQLSNTNANFCLTGRSEANFCMHSSIFASCITLPPSIQYVHTPMSSSQHVLAVMSSSQHVLALMSSSQHALILMSSSQHVLTLMSSSQHVLTLMSSSSQVLTLHSKCYCSNVQQLSRFRSNVPWQQSTRSRSTLKMFSL